MVLHPNRPHASSLAVLATVITAWGIAGGCARSRTRAGASPFLGLCAPPHCCLPHHSVSSPHVGQAAGAAQTLLLHHFPASECIGQLSREAHRPASWVRTYYFKIVVGGAPARDKTQTVLLSLYKLQTQQLHDHRPCQRSCAGSFATSTGTLSPSAKLQLGSANDPGPAVSANVTLG